MTLARVSGRKSHKRAIERGVPSEGSQDHILPALFSVWSLAQSVSEHYNQLRDPVLFPGGVVSKSIKVGMVFSCALESPITLY